VRFLFCDRILELEPGNRAMASKMVSLSEEFLPDHYPRQPVMPSTLVMESLVQLAGWLYVVTENFAVTIVLGLAQGVSIPGMVRPGESLILEASVLYGHSDGVTMRGEARRGDEVILRAERMLFASRPSPAEADVARLRDLFRYVSGGFEVRREDNLERHPRMGHRNWRDIAAGL
jgi:3-hydroxyacyl-[acyl-carrier-protein] dehydratase